MGGTYDRISDFMTSMQPTVRQDVIDMLSPPAQRLIDQIIARTSTLAVEEEERIYRFEADLVIERERVERYRMTANTKFGRF